MEFYKYPEEALHYFWEAEVVEVRPEGVLTLLPQGGVFHHVGKGRSLVLDHDAYVAFFPGAWYSGGPTCGREGPGVLLERPDPGPLDGRGLPPVRPGAGREVPGRPHLRGL